VSCKAGGSCRFLRNFPTVSEGGLAPISTCALRTTDWGAIMPSLLAQNTTSRPYASDCGGGKRDARPSEMELTAQLVLQRPRSRTRRTGEVKHANAVARSPQPHARALVLVRADEDPTDAIHVYVTSWSPPLHPTGRCGSGQWATQRGHCARPQSVGCSAWQGCVDEAQLRASLRRALANELCVFLRSVLCKR